MDLEDLKMDNMMHMPLKDRLNVHVIGAGGTGGWCVEFLARQIGRAHV